ncbi:GNRR2 protein, partial [Regulus satrapa]|nr:GNRR2 protein [Regulus satrapa]
PPRAATAPVPVVAGRGHADPGPAVRNASAEPPSGTAPEGGCAWSPSEESGEEPLRLPTFSPAAQVRAPVSARGDNSSPTGWGCPSGSGGETLLWPPGPSLAQEVQTSISLIPPPLPRQLFLFHTITLRPPHNFTQCTTRGSFPRAWHETLYNMTGFACLFLLPLLIMVCCYARILLEISRRMGSGLFSSQDASLRCSRNNIPRARLRMLRMSLVIVSSFILCWTPYYLLGLWHWFCPRAMEKRISPALTHILFIFGLFNACLDPITYGLFTIPLRGGWGCPCRHGPPAQPPSP